jgi:hypothetical protein
MAVLAHQCKLKAFLKKYNDPAYWDITDMESADPSIYFKCGREMWDLASEWPKYSFGRPVKTFRGGDWGVCYMHVWDREYTFHRTRHEFVSKANERHSGARARFDTGEARRAIRKSQPKEWTPCPKGAFCLGVEWVGDVKGLDFEDLEREPRLLWLFGQHGRLEAMPESEGEKIMWRPLKKGEDEIKYREEEGLGCVIS